MPNLFRVTASAALIVTIFFVVMIFQIFQQSVETFQDCAADRETCAYSTPK